MNPRLFTLLALLPVSWAAAAGCECSAPAPRTAIPVVRAVQSQGPINLDGRLDEPDWTRTPTTEAFVSTLDGTPSPPAARARVLWREEGLLLAFEVEDPLLLCGFRQHDDTLWEQDVVEVMVDPDGDGRRYVELQVSPSGLVFDTWFDTRRQPAPFGHRAWSSDLEAGVQTRGEVDDADEDEGYTVEMSIPWSAFDPSGGAASPPSSGDEWRVALYVLDAREEGQWGVGWSAPLVGDFHVPERFGRVRFE